MKKTYAKYLRNIEETLKKHHPQYLDIIVFDDEVFQPSLGLLLSMVIDCFELEPLPKERTD